MKNSIKYDSTLFDREGEVIGVSPIPLAQAKSYAPDVLRVMRIAYSQHDQNHLVNLTGGAVWDHFSDSRTPQQSERMFRAMQEDGSVYWRTRILPPKLRDPVQMVGVAKTTPSLPRLGKALANIAPSLDRPNCYLNDLAVVTPRRYLGTMTLYAALRGWPTARHVVADVVPGTEGFFEKYGFSPKGRPNHGLVIGNTNVPLTRYEAKIGDVLAATREKLQRFLSP